MQLQVSGQQVDVTPALRNHVESKLEGIDRLFENITSLNVVLSIEKLKHRVDATLAAAGRTLHANASEADMYTSIDVVFDKLVNQLRKHKEKVTDHHQAKVRKERYA